MSTDRHDSHHSATDESSADPQHEHTLVVRITYETKRRLEQLASDLDRTNSDIVRVVLRLGIPLLESLSTAERLVVREYTDIFRKLRQMRSLKDL